MGYPLSLGLPLLLSVLLQTLLWVGVLFHVQWLDRIALLGIAAGGLGVASIALLFYRLLAIGRPWSLVITIAMFLQSAAFANSVLFLYSAYTGGFPDWMN